MSAATSTMFFCLLSTATASGEASQTVRTQHEEGIYKYILDLSDSEVPRTCKISTPLTYRQLKDLQASTELLKEAKLSAKKTLGKASTARAQRFLFKKGLKVGKDIDLTADVQQWLDTMDAVDKLNLANALANRNDHCAHIWTGEELTELKRARREQRESIGSDRTETKKKKNRRSVFSRFSRSSASKPSADASPTGSDSWSVEPARATRSDSNSSLSSTGSDSSQRSNRSLTDSIRSAGSSIGEFMHRASDSVGEFFAEDPEFTSSRDAQLEKAAIAFYKAKAEMHGARENVRDAQENNQQMLQSTGILTESNNLADLDDLRYQ